MTSRFAMLAALTSVGVAGCWVPVATGDKMQEDIRQLQQKQDASAKGLDEQRARLDEQMKRADQKIEEVARAIEELNRAARSTDADFGVQMDRVIKDMQELRGTAELNDYRLNKLEGKIDGDGSLAARLEALEKQPTAQPASKDKEPAGKDAGDKDPPKGKKDLLAYADKLAKDGKVSDARGVWRDIVKQWPSETGVTDEAYYRIGESYYDEKKCRNALGEYIHVVEKFGNGSRGADAYYKIGLCSLDIGNLEDAKIFFSEILKSYKKSPLAKSAQQKLDDVNKRLEKEAKEKKGKK